MGCERQCEREWGVNDKMMRIKAPVARFKVLQFHTAICVQRREKFLEAFRTDGNVDTIVISSQRASMQIEPSSGLHLQASIRTALSTSQDLLCSWGGPKCQALLRSLDQLWTLNSTQVSFRSLAQLRTLKAILVFEPWGVLIEDHSELWSSESERYSGLWTSAFHRICKALLLNRQPWWPVEINYIEIEK